MTAWVGSALALSASPATPQVPGIASPRDTARASIGGASIVIDYGRPSKRDREIFGGLVPWDRVWRTGANEATTLVTDRVLVFGTVEVAAGRFTLFTVPSPDHWVLIVSRPTGRFGLDFNPDSVVARITMASQPLAEPVEQFLIRIEPREEGGVLRLQWDRIEAFAPFTVKRGESQGARERGRQGALHFRHEQVGRSG